MNIYMYMLKIRYRHASTSYKKDNAKREMSVFIDILTLQRKELKIVLTMIEDFVG